jgi:hypothetical protein
MSEKLKRISDEIFTAVSGFVARSIGPVQDDVRVLQARNAVLEDRVADLERRLAEAEDAKRLRSVA